MVWKMVLPCFRHLLVFYRNSWKIYVSSLGKTVVAIPKSNRVDQKLEARYGYSLPKENMLIILTN